MLCVARVASAEPPPLTNADFAGRWESTDATLTLDLAPCGNGWCGVVVANNACGHTALRMSESAEDTRHQTGKSRYMSGQLKLAGKTLPYGVMVRLIRRDEDGIRLSISGHTNGFSPVRRSYDYSNLFARIGEATCAPDPKTS